MQSNYIDALKTAADLYKSSMAVFGVPLGVVFVQLRFFTDNESIFVSALATIAVLSLGFGLVISWLFSAVIRILLAKEQLLNAEDVGEKGFKYLSYLEEKLKQNNPGAELTEEYLVELEKAYDKPILYSLYAGYGSLAILTMILIWVHP